MKSDIKIHIKENDTVFVLTGKDKGKQGRVLNINREKGKVTVEGIMVATQHKKQTSGKRGETGIIKTPLPIDISNIRLVCPRCNKATKFSREEVKGKRVRRCKSCKEYIDQV